MLVLPYRQVVFTPWSGHRTASKLFSTTDFLAEVLQHLPDPGMRSIPGAAALARQARLRAERVFAVQTARARRHGLYSSRSRGTWLRKPHLVRLAPKGCKEQHTPQSILHVGEAHQDNPDQSVSARESRTAPWARASWSAHGAARPRTSSPSSQTPSRSPESSATCERPLALTPPPSTEHPPSFPPLGDLRPSTQRPAPFAAPYTLRHPVSWSYSCSCKFIEALIRGFGLSDEEVRFTDFCAGVPVAVERFRMAERIFLPFVTMAELRAGFLAGTEGERNARVLSIFLNRARGRTLWPDENTTHHYARIWLQLRRQGTPIPMNDQQQEARSKGPRGSRPPG